MKPMRFRYIHFFALISLGFYGAHPAFSESSELGPSELVALERVAAMSCTACHQPSSQHELLRFKHAPRLNDVGGRINPHHIERFLLSPSKVRPGTRMPDVLHALPEGERAAAATALTHYLVKDSSSRFDIEPIDDELATKGFDLFNTLGCAACHNPRSEHADEILLKGSQPLGDLTEKYSVASLSNFLQDPLAVRPSGLMPDLNLTLREAQSIAHFLLQQSKTESNKADRKEFVVDQALAAKGSRYFVALNCVQCHQPEKATSSFTSFENLARDKGCLSTQEGPWPAYHLSGQDKALISQAQEALSKTVSSQDRIAFTLRQHRCLACHERGNEGGVADSRQDYFVTEDPNLGPQGRVPPSLDHVGARLTEPWLKKVLYGGEKVRPYMKTRMPRFGDDNVGHLIALLKEVDTLPPLTDIPELSKQEEREFRTQGEQLMGMNFACYACHTFKGKSGGAIQALDLYTTINRVEKNYFYHFLMNPQKFKKGVIMPSFFPSGKSPFHDVLGGDSRKQIEAMWIFLSGDFYYLPKGLVAPKALVEGNTDHAVILRRSFSGLHRRGISVAYPSGINLVFNPQELDVFSMWQGGFLDASPAFNRQGEGGVQPDGEKQVTFPKGPVMCFWKEGDPWPSEKVKELGFQFKGYQLGEKQRPTFFYDYNGMTIKDYFEDSAPGGEPMFKRTLMIDAPDKVEGLVLRLPQVNGKTPMTISIEGAGEPLHEGTEAVADSTLYPLPAFHGTKTITITYSWGEQP